MYDSLYERGIAVGSADIRNDTVLFRYRDETFEFPTSKVYHMRFGPDEGLERLLLHRFPVEKLRELKQELEKTP
jgi:hypothetical protein